MAFNYPGNYPGYFGGYPPQNPYQDQLTQLRSQQFQPVNQPGSGLLWVQGEAGAKSYLMAPNSTVLLMDSEAQRFYLKTTDASGVPGMRVFEYTEVMPNQPKVLEISADKFVTREEFMNFVNSITQKTEVANA